jgi:hypothetical protein
MDDINIILRVERSVNARGCTMTRSNSNTYFRGSSLKWSRGSARERSHSEGECVSALLEDRHRQ